MFPAIVKNGMLVDLTVFEIPDGWAILTAMHIGNFRVYSFAIFVVISFHTMNISIFIQRIYAGKGAIFPSFLNQGGLLLLCGI